MYLVKAGLAQAYSDLGRADIGGFRDDALNRQVPVRGMVMQGLARVVEMAVLAKEDVAQLDQALVEGAADHNDFEGGTRLVVVGDHPVAERVRRERAGMVGIKSGAIGQGQNLAGARADHDGGDADRGKLAHAGGQFGLHDVLQTGVQREHHIESVARLDVLVAILHQFVLALVQFGVTPAADAVELGIVFQLNAVHAGLILAIAADIPDDMRGEGLARIDALLVVGGENRPGVQRAGKQQIRALELGFVHAQGKGGHGLPDSIPGFQGGIVFEGRVVGKVGLAAGHDQARRQAIQQVLLVGFQHRGERAGHRGAEIAEHGRIGADQLAGDAGGQRVAADIQNLAAHGIAGDGANGVVGGQAQKLLVPDDLQIDQLPRQQPERRQQPEGQRHHLPILPDHAHCNISAGRPRCSVPPSELA